MLTHRKGGCSDPLLRKDRKEKSASRMSKGPHVGRHNSCWGPGATQTRAHAHAHAPPERGQHARGHGSSMGGAQALGIGLYQIHEHEVLQAQKRVRGTGPLDITAPS